MVQVTPNAVPRIKYDISTSGGVITLNHVWNLDTEEEWAGTDPVAIGLWADQLTRGALANRAGVIFDSYEFSDYTRQDVYGVVTLIIMEDLREEWEPIFTADFANDEELAAALGDGRLEIIWAAYR